MRDISLHLMDIAQNSVKAGADNIYVEISVGISIENQILTMLINDNGCGMSKEMAKKVFDPFTTTRTTRKVGLGIPLLAQNCEMADGNVIIKSKLRAGTTLVATFSINHIDRLPLGDIGSTMATLMVAREDINYTLTLKSEIGVFNVSTSSIKEVLGSDVSLNNVQILQFIIEYINENTQNIFGGILDEIIS